MYKVQVMGPVGDEIQSYFGVLKREMVSVQLLLKWLRWATPCTERFT